MEIKSLGRLTDFIFLNFSGTVEDKGSYTVAQTKNNPSFHWGNYIVFDKPPREGDLKRWTQLFDKEFPFYSKPHHYTFTWDPEVSSKGDVQEFLDADFEFDSAVVLTTEKIVASKYVNKEIEIRKISSAEDWQKSSDLQTLCADPKYLNDYFEDYKKGQIKKYKEMSEAGKGNWFGAFIGEQLVGELGLYFEGKVGRYQNVGTHPEYRGRGICGNLVYEAGKIALKEFGVKNLVMEADPGYHAARVYESVGFKASETNYSLSWWKK